MRNSIRFLENSPQRLLCDDLEGISFITARRLEPAKRANGGCQATDLHPLVNCAEEKR